MTLETLASRTRRSVRDGSSGAENRSAESGCDENADKSGVERVKCVVIPGRNGDARDLISDCRGEARAESRQVDTCY